ncbi:Glycosyltransferase involved in cell wall bisynthesis [bacterium A37T11]|nr:Glycosyltransferase involved in cell wall bisynthesis [bacterium A37T11]
MNADVLIDSRWAGNTGIGKLYQEVMARIPPRINPAFVESHMGLGNLFSPLMLSAEIRKAHASVFYSPSFMPPIYSQTPFVCTIHDLMHLFYYTPLHKFYYQQVIARLAKKAKQIITVSHFSKQQLTELLGIPPNLISVVYNGVDEAYAANEKKHSVGRPYFFYIGNQRKNKNIPAMLSAFAMARVPQDFIFLLSGQASPELEQLISKLDIKERVRFLGFVPESDLPKLYKGAFATLYVSLMEGFGLPIIESMASGTPVITSNSSSLPEIAGGAALCVDPKSVEAIAAGIEKLVNDRILYQQYQQWGYERAKQFNWEDTANKTWNIILNP